MKLSVICLCLTVKALAYHASPVFKRDLATITGVLDNVTVSIQKLKLAVDAGPGKPEPLLLASNGLIAALKAGAIKVNEIGNIDFLDSVRLIRPVHELTALGESLTSNLKNARSSFKNAGLCAIARLQIASINHNSQDLINAVNGKLPPEALEISKELTSGLTNVLAQSEDQFSEESCKLASDGPLSSMSTSGFDSLPMMVAAAVFLVSLTLMT